MGTNLNARNRLPEAVVRTIREAIEEKVREELRGIFPSPEAEGPLPAIESFFPSDFDPVAEAKEIGVREVRVARIYGGAPARYCPDTKTIEISPHLDREKIASEIRSRTGVRVKPEEVAIWLLYHEAVHHTRKRHIPPRNGLLSLLSLSDEIEIAEEEREVERIAEDWFYRRWRWRRT